VQQHKMFGESAGRDARETLTTRLSIVTPVKIYFSADKT
jgi:hypothetical protein